MTFIQKLEDARISQNSLVCVGLDPDFAKIPDSIRQSEFPVFEFNKAIIEATADLVCAYKPQIAYYAAEERENELAMTIDFLKANYPKIPVILDAKRGDIGATAAKYAEEAFVRYRADAVTVNPYMGGDTLEPFLKYEDKGVIVLCRTSNAGAQEFQNLTVDGTPLYQVVAQKAANEWNGNNNVLLVVGATFPEELAQVRGLIGDMPILMPGLGAQGGDVQKAIEAGLNSNGAGLIVNSSRGIIFAGNGPDFASKSREATEKLKNEINQFRPSA